MKKLMVLVIVLAMSAMMFAGEGRGFDGGADCQGKGGFGPGNGPKMGMMGGERKGGHGELNIFDRVTKEDFLKAGVTEDNYIKAKVIVETNKTAFEKNHIAIQQKHLEIKKLTLDENKNYTEIEKLFNEIGKLEADNGVRAIKVRDEVKKYITEDQVKAAMENLRARHPGKEFRNDKNNDQNGDNNKDRGMKMPQRDGNR